MLNSKKYCAMCGTLIGDLDDPNEDYYSFIARRYCPICAKTAERMHLNARVRRWRERKRKKDAFRDEQLTLLQEENALLRQRITELRERR